MKRNYISIPQLIKKYLKRIPTILFVFWFATLFAQSGTPILPNQITGMVGYWDYENTSNLFQSTSGLGSDLIPAGSSGSITQINGPDSGDKAISKIKGKYLKCNHSIPANGWSPINVNKYSILIDFRMPTVNNWKSFYQTNVSNSNDGDLFMNTSAHIGIATVGYSSSAIIANEWYRLVMTVDCGNSIKYFIDGQQWVPGFADIINGRFSLELNGVLLFADDNGEDGNMDIAKVVLFNRNLSDNEIFDLGGYGHTPNVTSGGTSMNPYLQTPTPTSIFISWHSSKTSTPAVSYGTSSSNLNQSAQGSSQIIGGNILYRWHTVKLTGLTPNTEYFYKCFSGTDSTSAPIAFKTPPLQGTPGQHLRFIVLGDNRTDVSQATSIALNIKAKLAQKFGPDYHKYVNLICNIGDIVSTGLLVNLYESEYFTPFAPLTKNIPTMISIGNHEGNSSNYYDYMKYEDLTDDYPSPHPYNEKFYQFYYGSSQFIFLNANTSYRITPQLTWLTDRLTESDNNPLVDFVFSFTHQPGHSEVWPDGNENYVQSDLFGVMKQFHKCAAHFYGHSHNYERGLLELNSPDITQHHDMRQMLSGGAGSALDRWGAYPNQTDYSEINKSLDIYCWSLIDVDMDAKSYNCETYSFGNSSSPQNNLLVDSFYRKITQPGPFKAMVAGVVNNSELVAFPMQGADSAFTCHFQVTSVPGDYSSPLLEKKQDRYNIYEDSGSPNWMPVDLNANLDLKRYSIQPADNLTPGNSYGFRVRYRDHNLEWGPWSDEMVFTYLPSTLSDPVDFIADSLNIPAGYKVSFTDLSGTNATSWKWDFNNDGTFESNLQDPFYQYNQAGDYTVSLTINQGGSGNIATKNAYIHVNGTLGVKKTGSSPAEISVYPNPFTSNTSITINLMSEKILEAEIIDGKSNLVRKLAKGTFPKGQRTLIWDGKSDGGKKMSPGSYFLNLKGENIRETKKIILE